MAWDAEAGIFSEDNEALDVARLIEPMDTEEFVTLRNRLIYDLWHGAEGSGEKIDRVKCTELANSIMSFVAARASYTLAHRVCWIENRLPTLAEIEKAYRKLIGISDFNPVTATIKDREKTVDPKTKPAFRALRAIVLENPGTDLARDLTMVAKRILSRHRAKSAENGKPKGEAKPPAQLGSMQPLANIELPMDIKSARDTDLPEIG